MTHLHNAERWPNTSTDQDAISENWDDDLNPEPFLLDDDLPTSSELLADYLLEELDDTNEYARFEREHRHSVFSDDDEMADIISDYEELLEQTAIRLTLSLEALRQLSSPPTSAILQPLDKHLRQLQDVLDLDDHELRLACRLKRSS